jgi:hypothetical protein
MACTRRRAAVALASAALATLTEHRTVVEGPQSPGPKAWQRRSGVAHKGVQWLGFECCNHSNNQEVAVALDRVTARTTHTFLGEGRVQPPLSLSLWSVVKTAAAL